MTQQDPKQPIKEFRVGGISSSVWCNETEQDGRIMRRHSVRLKKRYRDRRTGEWKDSDYLFADDLPRARLVLDKAYEYVVLKESEEGSDLPTVAV
jgi:hypothetical protein